MLFNVAYVLQKRIGVVGSLVSLRELISYICRGTLQRWVSPPRVYRKQCSELVVCAQVAQLNERRNRRGGDYDERASRRERGDQLWRQDPPPEKPRGDFAVAPGVFLAQSLGFFI